MPLFFVRMLLFVARIQHQKSARNTKRRKDVARKRQISLYQQNTSNNNHYHLHAAL